MYSKWVGSILIISACSGMGFSIAAGYRKKVKMLRQMIRILDFMRWNLQYQLTPLPDLCRQAAGEINGDLKQILLDLSENLDYQSAPDVCSSMTAILRKHAEIPYELRSQLLHLGHILGRFDLPGQLKGLQAVKRSCEENLNHLNQGKESRLRSYQTLGICAGLALVILLV